MKLKGITSLGELTISKIRKYSKHTYVCVLEGLRNLKSGKIFDNNIFEINKTEFENNINILFNNLIELINEGEYKRFNVSDFYNKSSKITLICDAIMVIKNYNNQNLMGITNSHLLLINIMNAFPFLTDPILKLDYIISNEKIQNKEMVFIEVRNLIAKEWLKRNVLTNPNLKDLNYLKYTIEEYHEYLHNCLNMLIRDTKRFISRYPLEYKTNPDLDVELLLSLRNSIFNDIRVPNYNYDNNIDFIGLSKIVTIKETSHVIKSVQDRINKELEMVVVRGWYRDQPKSNYITATKYREYRRSY